MSLDGISVVDADDVLVDDRSGIELAGHVMTRRADQLHAALKGLVVRFGSGE